MFEVTVYIYWSYWLLRASAGPKPNEIDLSRRAGGKYLTQKYITVWDTYVSTHVECDQEE